MSEQEWRDAIDGIAACVGIPGPLLGVSKGPAWPVPFAYGLLGDAGLTAEERVERFHVQAELLGLMEDPDAAGGVS